MLTLSVSFCRAVCHVHTAVLRLPPIVIPCTSVSMIMIVHRRLLHVSAADNS